MRPRRYQLEAAEWALRRGRAVVCMPTGTGKTLIAWLWASRLLREGKARRVLFLEPTRFLVEQVTDFLRRMGARASAYHGSVPRRLRMLRASSSTIVVATPEAVASDIEFFKSLGFEAVVVDECHHTTGQDAYVKVMRGLEFRWRLGLTPLVPPSRRAEIEGYIGEVWCRGWDDPEIARYIPSWAGEVYEAPFNSAERSLYEAIEARWESAGRGGRSLLGNALRWMARDGVQALRETFERSERLRRLMEGLEDLLYDRRVRGLHKLEALLRALRDHEPLAKAIVFVERVSVARMIAEALESEGLRAAVLVGRRWGSPSEALARARRGDTRVVVATSAGEEGIDMPEADMVVVWSNVASPLRFVQRLGRMLRASRAVDVSRQKYAVFIVTPDTVDVDSLVDGITEAVKAGVAVNVEASTVERLMRESRRRRILEALEERPMTVDLLSQALRAPLRRLEPHISWLLRRGLLVYIYTRHGRVYAPSYSVDTLRRLYPRETTPDPGAEATITYEASGSKGRIRGDRASAGARLRRVLASSGTIQGMRIAARILEGSIIRQYTSTYSFPVNSEEVLDLVLDNGFSVSWRREEAM